MAVVAVLVSNTCLSDARVLKMARAARDLGHEVHLFATMGGGAEPYEHKDGIYFHRFEWRPIVSIVDLTALKYLAKIARPLALLVAKLLSPYLRYRSFAYVFAEKVCDINPDIIHAHDLICLPAAVSAAEASGAKVVYDAHELEVHRNPPLPFHRKLFVSHIEKLYSSKASAIITVGNNIANILYQEVQRPIDVVYNSPVIQGCGKNIRSDLGLDANVNLLIYVGKVTAGRGVGDMLSILPKLKNVHFSAIGPCDKKQEKILMKQARRWGVQDRFRLLPPVPFEQVVSYISGADVGIISVEPVTLSYRHCMPNKLFELSFANVPIVSNKLDEISEFLARFGNGMVVDFGDQSKVVYCITKMLCQKESFIMDADKMSELGDEFSWNSQVRRIEEIYNRVLQSESYRLSTG